MDALLSVLEELLGEADDADTLLDLLQELEPQELKDICKNSWALELVLSYCNARKN